MTTTRAARIMTMLLGGAVVAAGGAAFAAAASSTPEVSDAPIASALAARPVTVVPSKEHELAQVTFVNECLPDRGVQRPQSLHLACADEGFRLEDLRWKDWGAAAATATATATVNDCRPTCARGTTHRAPVEVTADRLHHREATQVYTSLTVTYTKTVPKGEERTSTYALPR